MDDKRKRNIKASKNILTQIREFALAQNWEELDAMFSDELLNSDLDSAKCTLIVHSRYYDHWLAKRQGFLDAVLQQDFIKEEDKTGSFGGTKWLEGCRHYKISEDHMFMTNVGFNNMGIKGLGPDGLIENPELVKELLKSEGVVTITEEKE
jgi:hypothetical protein